jgi:hypothetical protein
MRNQEEYSYNLGDRAPDASGNISRQSMNKNYRVGKIKFYAKSTMGERGLIAPAILLQILEWCGSRWSTYNIWVSVDDKHDVSRADVGSWAEVGFYIKGSFREKSGLITTELKMRHLTILGGDAEEDIVIGEEEYIKEENMISIPVSAATTAREIYLGTQYTPVRVEEEITN